MNGWIQGAMLTRLGLAKWTLVLSWFAKENLVFGPPALIRPELSQAGALSFRGTRSLRVKNAGTWMLGPWDMGDQFGFCGVSFRTGGRGRRKGMRSFQNPGPPVVPFLLPFLFWLGDSVPLLK